MEGAKVRDWIDLTRVGNPTRFYSSSKHNTPLLRRETESHMISPLGACHSRWAGSSFRCTEYCEQMPTHPEDLSPQKTVRTPDTGLDHALFTITRIRMCIDLRDWGPWDECITLGSKSKNRNFTTVSSLGNSNWPCCGSPDTKPTPWRRSKYRTPGRPFSRPTPVHFHSLRQHWLSLHRKLIHQVHLFRRLSPQEMWWIRWMAALCQRWAMFQENLVQGRREHLRTLKAGR